MKKMMLMAAMMLSGVAAMAQPAAGTFSLQPKVGLNVTTIGDNDWKAGFTGGVEGMYQIDKNWGLAAGVLYSQQGLKSKDNKVEFLGQSYKVGGEKWSPAYINVPVTLNYYVAPGFALKAGVQPGFMVDKDGAGDGVKTVDVSIPVGASYEYAGFVFDARYNIGVTKAFDKGDGYNNVLQFTVGYKFSL